MRGGERWEMRVVRWEDEGRGGRMRGGEGEDEGW